MKGANKSFVNSILAVLSILVSKVSTNYTRPHIGAVVQGVSTVFLWDTGAGATIMSVKDFRKIPIDKRPAKMPHFQKLVSASGDIMTVAGVYNLKYQIGKREIYQPTFVCHDPNTQNILGINAIGKLAITWVESKKKYVYDEIFDSVDKQQNFCFQENIDPSNYTTEISTVDKMTIPPLTHATVPLIITPKKEYTPPPGVCAIAHIFSGDFPLLTNSPGLVQIDGNGKIHVRVCNSGPTPITIPRNAQIGLIEMVPWEGISRIDEKAFVSAISKVSPRPAPLLDKDKKFIFENLNITVPDSEIDAYKLLIEKNHDIFSKGDLDIGLGNNFNHRIHMRTNEPVYVPQFRIADAYREGLHSQIKDWLKMGIIQPSHSLYNSPIFVVPKKNGQPRYVLDYRALNTNSVDDKYTMRTIEDCIADIGYKGSTIFSSLDLKDGFYQLPLDKASRHMTSFTVPPLGQFMFCRSPMGIKSSPAQLQRMMELAMKGLDNVIVYFDDLLIHSKSHDQHRVHLQAVFDRLRATNLKLKVAKCHFGCTNVEYLGFRLTPQGILPGKDKLKCVRDALPPRNVHEVRQFLGLANFFRSHVRNFASISAPLNKLTRKDINWRNGILPPDALQAFNELKTALISEPVVAYPRADKPYALIVDSATGNDTKEGGIGAILCQADDNGNFNVISYASRSLSKHEKNYSAFLIELTGCAWGIEHFSTYLKGRKFTLFTDHRPLEKLSTVHKKTFLAQHGC